MVVVDSAVDDGDRDAPTAQPELALRYVGAGHLQCGNQVGRRPGRHLSLFALDLHDRIDAHHTRKAAHLQEIAGRGTHHESVPEFSNRRPGV
jgi:hypothetical protein